MKLQWLIIMVCVAITTVGCGQRTFVESPEGKVEDTQSY